MYTGVSNLATNMQMARANSQTRLGKKWPLAASLTS